MYKLYYDPGSANMAPHAVLIETGAEHELILVDIAKGENRQPEYLKIHPHGRVPALEQDGLVTYESSAITMYLADRHPEAKLAPPPDATERALYLQWMAHLTNTVQESLMHWHHPDFYAPEEIQAAVKSHAEKRLDEHWRYFDNELAQRGPYLLGETFSAADIFFTMLTRWTRNMAVPADTYDHVRLLVEKVRARPAYREMMRAEGIA